MVEPYKTAIFVGLNHQIVESPKMARRRIRRGRDLLYFTFLTDIYCSSRSKEKKAINIS